MDTSSCAFKHIASIFPQNSVLGRSQPRHLRDLVHVWPGLATSYLASPHFHFLLARALAHDHQRNQNKNSPGTCVYWKLPPMLLSSRSHIISPLPRSRLEDRLSSWIPPVSICCWVRNEWSQIWAGLGNKHGAGGQTQKTGDI